MIRRGGGGVLFWRLELEVWHRAADLRSLDSLTRNAERLRQAKLQTLNSQRQTSNKDTAEAGLRWVGGKRYGQTGIRQWLNLFGKVLFSGSAQFSVLSSQTQKSRSLRLRAEH